MITYSNLELEKSSRSANGKPRYLVKQEEVSAIEAAINHYKEKGSKVLWTGNEYWWVLMTLIFWDGIFAPVEGAVQVSIKNVIVDLKPNDKRFNKLFAKTIDNNGAPADFMTPEFYPRRKKIFDDLIQELRNRNLERRLLTSFNENVGLFVQTVEDWARFPSQLLRIAVNRLEPDKILGICERLISNFKDHRFGLPDLMVYNDSEVYFAEVLEEGESLTPEKTEWHDYFSKALNLKVEVVLINRSSEEVLELENAYTPVEHEVTISFAHAVGKLTSKEVDIVRAQDSYFTNDDGIERRHGATFPITEEKIGEVFELLDLIGGWESEKIELDGEEISASQFREGLRCFKYKAKLGEPLDYCKTGEFSKKPNIFGCRAFMFKEFEENIWLEHGSIDRESGDWVFNKHSIANKADREKSRLKICPLFRSEKIDTALDNLPARIKPRNDTDWAYIDRDNGIWFWHERRWLSVFGKVRVPDMDEMCGIKKLTGTERSQALHYLEDQKKKEESGPAEPLEVKNSKPCFIATAVYGDESHRAVAVLQDYRDTRMLPHRTGRSLIDLYYMVSPPIAKLIGKYPRIGLPVKFFLDRVVARLEKNSR